MGGMTAEKKVEKKGLTVAKGFGILRGIEGNQAGETTKGNHMKIQNAIAKIEKAGFTVTTRDGSLFSGIRSSDPLEREIHFRRNGNREYREDVTLIRTTSGRDDDTTIWHDTITRAIRHITGH